MNTNDNTDNTDKIDNIDNALRAGNSSGNNSEHTTRLEKVLGEDIHDSPQDEEKMKTEIVILDLPDVSDIPGQESIVVPNIGEMQDTTISSDDEEGVGLFGDDDNDDDEVEVEDAEDDADEDTELVIGNEADVSPIEKTLLKRANRDMPGDDESLRKADLDKTDDQGDLLNEGSLATDVSGGDLDVPGADSDDEREQNGEEDEENNSYSLGSDSNDNVTEGTP